MRTIVAFCIGGLFGIGLLISGMTDTTVVQGWLDVFGNWDPTLAFVMGGAIIPMFFAWRFTNGRSPVLAQSFPDVSDVQIDRRVVVGSLMFGAGWGLSGLCPGPAMASLLFGGMSGLAFFISMAVGMAALPRVRQLLDPQAEAR